MRSIVLVALLSLALNGAGPAGCETRQGNGAQNVKKSGNNNVPATPTHESETNKDVDNNLKVLAEGGQSGVDDAFVAVARDVQTYEALREMASQLPEVNADSFGTNAVVAAFLGRRNTGGYGVQVIRAGDGAIRLAESRPPKGAVVTQSLTTPFKVVSVPISDVQPLSLEMEGEWKTMTRPYSVATATFTVTGGFAGTSEDFRLEGDIGVMRAGKLATLAFDLKTTGQTKARTLKDVATGVVLADGSIKITHMAAGSLVSPPPSALRANGNFDDGENKLALTFESLPSNVADGYQGKGGLEATATAPPPQKRKSLGGNNPI
ncbi:MAG: protease complex subunit PrcB family protein [Pyrinomonadaceae bacterium]|nr:protease complex subunit PrcB family protein [Pyrinomonadaceae bacterium]